MGAPLLLLLPALLGNLPTPAQRLEAVAQQLPELAAWAAAAEERLARCECEGGSAPGLGAVQAARPEAEVVLESLASATLGHGDAALWLWRAIVGIIVVAATVVVMPHDKRLRQQKRMHQAAAASGDSTADARPGTDSSLASSLGDWAAGQEEAWSQPLPPPAAAAAAAATHTRSDPETIVGRDEAPPGLAPSGLAVPQTQQMAAETNAPGLGETSSTPESIESLQDQLVSIMSRPSRYGLFPSRANVARAWSPDRSWLACANRLVLTCAQVNAEAEVVRLRVLLDVAQSY
jgi:hypothetical protein